MFGLNTLIENLNPPKNRREQLKQIDGTPSFTQRNNPIEADGFWLINFEDHKEYGKWTPLNLIIIDNLSNNDLLAEINQNTNQAISIPANNSKTIRRDGIRQFKINEISGNSIDAGQIELTFTRNAVTSDELKRERKKKVLNLQ